MPQASAAACHAHECVSMAIEQNSLSALLQSVYHPYREVLVMIVQGGQEQSIRCTPRTSLARRCKPNPDQVTSQVVSQDYSLQYQYFRQTRGMLCIVCSELVQTCDMAALSAVPSLGQAGNYASVVLV